MQRIKLTQGKYALVDDADFDWLNQWKWRYSHGYANRAKQVNNKRVGDIHMHRLINNTPDGMDTDHINRDKLDNRRANLRSLSRSQNNFNSPPPKDNKSGVKGVYWSDRWKVWYAYIQVNGIRYHLGTHKTKRSAAEARMQAENKMVWS